MKDRNDLLSRETPRADTENPEARAWLRGYAAALASVERLFNQTSVVAWVAKSDGLTLADFRAADVDAFDMRELRKAFVKQKTTPIAVGK